MKLKQMIVAGSVLVLSMLGGYGVAAAQDSQYRLVHAKGEGTIKVGSEQMKVTNVIVKLLDDKKAEITLVADITFFLSATWSQNGESPEDFDLQVTGGASPGGLDGVGKLTLGKDAKSDTKLILKGKSRTTKKSIEVYFLGK